MLLFEYCHASVKLYNVDVLYLEYGNVYRPVLKNKTATMLFPKKKTFSNYNCYNNELMKLSYKNNGATRPCYNNSGDNNGLTRTVSTSTNRDQVITTMEYQGLCYNNNDEIRRTLL